MKPVIEAMVTFMAKIINRFKHGSKKTQEAIQALDNVERAERDLQERIDEIRNHPLYDRRVGDRRKNDETYHFESQRLQ